MTQQRWLRIIPVALIMYTISYVDRTNVSLALEPNISGMMKDLQMDDRTTHGSQRDITSAAAAVWPVNAVAKSRLFAQKKPAASHLPFATNS